MQNASFGSSRGQLLWAAQFKSERPILLSCYALSAWRTADRGRLRHRCAVRGPGIAPRAPRRARIPMGSAHQVAAFGV
eukprot:3208393-Alexandrium_andersonii.AAC.1